MTMRYYCSREISRVQEIGFQNPLPKINSNAQAFIKEARQSALEETCFQFPQNQRDRSKYVIQTGRERAAENAYKP